MVAKRPHIGYQAIVTALAVFMVSALLTSLSGFWKLGAPRNEITIIAAAAVVYGWLWWRAPWVALFGTLLGVLGVTVATAYGYLPSWIAYFQIVSREATEFVANVRVNYFESTFGLHLGKLFLGAVALPAGLLVMREVLVRGNTFWSIALGTLVFGTEWAWYYNEATEPFIAFAFVAFLLWTVGQAAVRDASWVSSGRKIGYRSHLTTPVAAIVIVGVLAALLPANFHPLDLGTFGERAQEAFPVLKRLRGAGAGGTGARFSLRITGFSPLMGALGGPVKLDHSLAMTVATDTNLSETAYLRGATFQVYDGRSWTAGDAADVEVPKDGTLPIYMATDVMREYRKYTLSPMVSMGFTIFNVWEPSQVEGLKNGFTADVDGNLFANKVIATRSTYDVTVRKPKYSADQIRQMSTAAPGEAYLPYLQLPDTLPKRVSDLSRTITASQAHPYDKAVAVETYLRRLPYELDVQGAPQGRDFVDYFLFDLKKGYCVYSATAMVVLLRDLGVPARLVEGFALPSSAQYTEGQGGKRTYSVMNSQAHAWVEAYFEGYGWVTFDPTPRADVPPIDRSLAAPRTESVTPEAGTGETDPNMDENDVSRPGGQELFEENFPGGGVPLPGRREWPWAVTALAALGGVIFLAYRRLQRQDRLTATVDREVVQEAWMKSGILLGLFGLGRKEHQTPREFARTLGQQWPKLAEPATQVAEDYTVSRYAPPTRPAPEGAAARAKSLWAAIHDVLFQKVGWRSYLWRRLRWSGKDE